MALSWRKNKIKGTFRLVNFLNPEIFIYFNEINKTNSKRKGVTFIQKGK